MQISYIINTLNKSLFKPLYFLEFYAKKIYILHSCFFSFYFVECRC
jgi:hypothetical protein